MEKAKPELVDWTEDKVTILSQMWKEGANVYDISAAIGHPNRRNAVIGKARRLGLGPHPEKLSKLTLNKDGKPKTQSKKRKPPKPAVIVPKVKEREHVDNGIPVEADYRFVRSTAWNALKGSAPVRLVDLQKHQCAWPIGKDSPFHFCALPVSGETRYCETHRYLSHPRT